MSAINVKSLDIEEIELDKDNPRIAAYVEQYGEIVSAESVAFALDDTGASGTSLATLRDSIKTQGGLIQPIIVNHTSDGKYVVIEGNTRLKIFQEFKEDHIKGNWDQIPAIVYENMTSMQINEIRLQAHMVGPREWSRYAKGKYLHKLYVDENLTSDQIAAICGGGKSEIDKMIKAYIDMEKYYRPKVESDDRFDPRVFSYFEETEKKNFLADLVNMGYSKDNFAQWVADGKISRAQSVRQLLDILRSDEAKKVFFIEGNDTDDAIKIVHKDEINKDDSEQLQAIDNMSLVRTLTERIAEMNRMEWNKLLKNPSGKEASEYKVLFSWLKDLVDDINNHEDDE